MVSGRLRVKIGSGCTVEVVDELLDVARLAARAGLVRAQEYFARLDDLDFQDKDTGKTVGSDVMSLADKAVEETIRRVILEHRPDDSILGEESGLSNGIGHTWVVDPIDGTLNFAYGRRDWAVSIAVCDQAGPAAAVVATTGPVRFYSATRGGGAHLDDRPIRPSGVTDLRRAMVDVGRGRGEVRGRFVDVLGFLDARVRDVRRSGCAALAACQVASGEIDAMYGPGLEPWDVTAGALIAVEAGAVVVDWRSDVVLLGAPGVIEEFERTVAEGLA